MRFMVVDDGDVCSDHFDTLDEAVERAKILAIDTPDTEFDVVQVVKTVEASVEVTVKDAE